MLSISGLLISSYASKFRCRLSSSLRRDIAGVNCPGAVLTTSVDEVVHSNVDAIVVATPIRTHYDQARQALERGKQVVVEKPLTASSRQAEELVALADRVDRVLMVGHTFMYNPAVEELRRRVQDGALGSLYHSPPEDPRPQGRGSSGGE